MGGINTGDTAFVLICAALVALMTPGLAFFYGGLVRRKNFLAIMMQSFISMGVVTTIWVFFGYSLAFSGDIGGVFGNLHWAMLTGVAHLPGPWAPNIPAQAHFVYQEMFAIITPALITGAFADRVKFKSYLWFLVLWSIIVYIPFVHWIWGGGWLMQHGVLDFAGGLVVHVSAGFAALASVFVVGRRKFGPGERGLPHNVAFVALGTGLLWFGWFGFNAGSALAANGIAAQAFVNTDIAGSIAMCTWLAISWRHDGKPSLVGALTGAVAGLACVTPVRRLHPDLGGVHRRPAGGFGVLHRRPLREAHEVGRRARRLGCPRCGRLHGRHPARRVRTQVGQPGGRRRPHRRQLHVLRLAGHRDDRLRGLRLRGDLPHPQGHRLVHGDPGAGLRGTPGPRRDRVRRDRLRPDVTERTARASMPAPSASRRAEGRGRKGAAPPLGRRNPLGGA